MSINLNQLAREINKQLKQYSDAINEEAQEEAKRLAQEGVKKLKATSPKDSGDYAKGWAVKKDKENYVLHNKTEYRLTHLLEKSHLQRDGSRSTPQPHIRKVEEEIIEQYERAIERIVEG